MVVERYTETAPAKKVYRESDSQPKTQRKAKVVGIKRMEMTIYIALAVLIAAVSIYVLSLKMEAYNYQSEKSSIEQSISVKEGEISELNTEVTYLASYDRIYEKAQELGLDLNNSNVKVVEKYGED
ncbi:Cell division protein FtsL [Jeotgalicoccus aerolatus]|uniref:Cell division protein FtsL n=1 Tax=Jeotgalicoccus aerolatus TaxID=709510 RepID=A0A1G8W3E9_9STAP|nr:cell division protein FtsL [Jeotgalicoccus aerolatus]MBP1951404.1 cell division protein FtsL [Jeotgalicoccus aerolatus]NMA81477.1 cell division protein FtsL [Jeotgalicoccus aerolatus]CAD2076813.1 Cell division protein FtsL [Jeotgalicoccus aerolatus]SDJ72646.1 cell division protein FtsL [Jeotgalicoccus aerolatus]GGD97802.1 cell division protein FtsL [Jeotgalicoccus aerolatus]